MASMVLFEVALEERAHELSQRALEVSEGGMLVDQKAFALVEHRPSVCLLAVGGRLLWMPARPGRLHGQVRTGAYRLRWQAK